MSTLVSFAATGVDQTWVVPPGVTEIEVDGAGAAGGDGNVVGHMDATDTAFVNVQSFNIRQNLTIPSASTPGTATIPSTMRVGDLLVVIAVEGGRTADPVQTVAVSTPGWNLIAQTPKAVNSTRWCITRIFARVMQAGDTVVTLTTTDAAPNTNHRTLATLQAVRPLNGTTLTIGTPTTDNFASVGSPTASWAPAMAPPIAAPRWLRVLVTASTPLSPYVPPWETPLQAGGTPSAGTSNYFWDQSSESGGGSMFFRLVTAGAPDGAASFPIPADTGVATASVVIESPYTTSIPKGGKGGRLKAKIPVTPGTTLTLRVGKKGATSTVGGGIEIAYPSTGFYGGAIDGAGVAGGLTEVVASGVRIYTAGSGAGAGSTSGTSKTSGGTVVVPNGGDGGQNPTAGVSSGTGTTAGTAASIGANGVHGFSSVNPVPESLGGYYLSSGRNIQAMGGGGGSGNAPTLRYGGGGGADQNWLTTAADEQGSGGGGGLSYTSGTVIAEITGYETGDGWLTIRYGPDDHCGIFEGTVTDVVGSANVQLGVASTSLPGSLSDYHIWFHSNTTGNPTPSGSLLSAGPWTIGPMAAGTAIHYQISRLDGAHIDGSAVMRATDTAFGLFWDVEVKCLGGGGAYQFRRGRRAHVAGATGVSIQGR